MQSTINRPESVILHFKATTGETAEITDGVNLPVVGYFTSDDGKYKMPCFETMSDFKYQLLILHDRLFHPHKYPDEDIPKVIDKVITWLSNQFPECERDEAKKNYYDIVDYVGGLTEEMKRSADIALYERIKKVK